MSTSERSLGGGLEHVQALLSDYVDGELSEAQRQVVEGHLETCSRCRSDLASLRLTVQAVRQLAPYPVPRSFAIPVARTPTPLLTWLRWSTGALAATFVVLLAAQFVLPSQAPSARLAPVAGRSNLSAPRAPAPAVATDQRSAAPAEAPAAAAAPTSAPAAPAAGAAQSQAAGGVAPPGATSERTTSASGPVQARAVALAGTVTPETYPGPSAPVTAPASPPPEVTGGPYPLQSPPSIASTSPYPSLSPPGAPPTQQGTGYPGPGPVGSPVSVAAGPTTWYSPALLIVGILVVVSAVALILLGRRH